MIPYFGLTYHFSQTWESWNGSRLQPTHASLEDNAESAGSLYSFPGSMSYSDTFDRLFRSYRVDALSIRSHLLNVIPPLLLVIDTLQLHVEVCVANTLGMLLRTRR